MITIKNDLLAGLAAELERLVASGGASALMPPRQSVQIMQTLDEIRRQIGLRYPGEA